MAWDKTWEDFYGGGGGNRYPEPAVIRFVFRYFSESTLSRDSIKILDLGAGAGAHLWFLAREGFSAYGIDGSVSAVNRARRFLRNENLNANISVGDFEALPFDSEYFHGVIDSASIQHNAPAEAKRILDEVYRVTKPGGFVFSMFLQSDRSLSAPGFVTTRLAESELRSLFKKFEVIDIDEHYYTENSKKKSITFSLVTAQKSNDEI